MDEKGITALIQSPCPALPGLSSGTSDRTYLIVVAGGIPGAMLPLVSGATWIGRAADNAIQLVEPSVSRCHALLRVTSDRQIELTDLGSTNGTFVNNERLRPDRPHAILDGDRLRFGTKVVLKFVRPDADEEQFQREMFERTVRDALTGLYNRSYFQNQFRPWVNQAAARGMGLAVLMLDIDHFKRFNDTYGHHAGDAALREVAHVLRQASRADDLLARYGGEEFLFALPVPSLHLAMARAESIRNALATRRLRLESAAVQVTVSIGVAFAPADRPQAVETMISTADLHLYEAKRIGRNRVVGPETIGPHPAVAQITTDGSHSSIHAVGVMGSTSEVEDESLLRGPV